MAVAEITETRTYLTFTLDEEDFAVDVSNVREVLDFTNVTKVPRTPDFMKGVINLRGSVVPVVDMRIKFGLEEAVATVDTCIIVMEVEMEGEATVIGALGDSVKEVFQLDPANIEPPPRIGTRLDTEFIAGMGKYNDDFIIILDINEVFSAEELILFKDAMDSPSARKSKPVKVGEAEEQAVTETSEETPPEEGPGEAEREDKTSQEKPVKTKAKKKQKSKTGK
jgi:purine-binding chemotaxis protein CheW